MVISGLTGEIRWSYLTAVVFGPWRLITEKDGTARLNGRVVSVDQFRSKQASLTAQLWIGKFTQKRAVTDLQIVGDKIIASLGAQEK